MIIAKLKIASLSFLAVALLCGLAGVSAYPALAIGDGKEKPRPAQVPAAKEDKKPQGPSVHGVVKSVDPAKSTITINTTELVNGKKQSDEKTFGLAKDLKVFLDDRLSKDQPAGEGRLVDLTAGTIVVVQLGEDKKSATAISARGPGLYGHVKAVDPGRNSLTFGVKESGGIVDKAVELAKDAKVLLNDGLKKGDKDQESKLADLTEGTPILIQLSVDRKTALGIRVQGASIHCTIKGLDIGSNTITVTMKEDAQIVDKTFSMVKDIQIDGGALAELTEGKRIVLRLSVFDKMKTVGIHVPKEGGQKED